MKITSTLLFIFCLSLGTQAQTKAEKKMIKQEEANLEYLQTKDLINSGNFIFEADRTIASGGGSISLVANYNQLKLENGLADISLPYFGTVWGGGGYNDKAEIKYKGELNNYRVVHNDKKRKSKITFKISKGTEVHNLVFTVGRRGYGSLLVKSSGRSSSTYDGYVKANMPLSD